MSASSTTGSCRPRRRSSRPRASVRQAGASPRRGGYRWSSVGPSRGHSSPGLRRGPARNPADEHVLDAMTLQHPDDAGGIEGDVVGAQAPPCEARAVRSESTSARKARTASRESSRRPSIVIETSSGVAGPPRHTACRRASRSQSSTTATRFALTLSMLRSARSRSIRRDQCGMYQRCINPVCTGGCCDVHKRPVFRHHACSAASSSIDYYFPDRLRPDLGAGGRGFESRLPDRLDSRPSPSCHRERAVGELRINVPLGSTASHGTMRRPGCAGVAVVGSGTVGP